MDGRVGKISDEHLRHQIEKIGHVVKIDPPIEEHAIGGSISPPMEVAGFLPIMIDGVKYLIALYYPA